MSNKTGIGGVGVLLLILLAGGLGKAAKAAPTPTPTPEAIEGEIIELPTTPRVTIPAPPVTTPGARIPAQTEAGVSIVRQTAAQVGTGEIVAIAMAAPAVEAGEVSVQEATRAIETATTTGSQAVVARALGYAPIPTTEELRAMTRGEKLAYQYGVSVEVGNMFATMTAGQILRYCQEHNI